MYKDGVDLEHRSSGRALSVEENEHMAYSDKVLDHYENPRNVGSFAKDDDDVGTGMVGAPACGDVMKLQIRVGKDGLIEDAKFKTYGCGSAIASSSLVTEWVKGKTLDEAMSIRNTQIAEELALPPVKIHCSILAEDAIKAAVADYKAKHGGRCGGAERAAAGRGRLNASIEGTKEPTMAITLTDTAAKHVASHLAKRGKGIGLRLGVRTSGCSGLAYKLEYADEREARGPHVREPRRDGGRRSEEPAVPRRDGARLRARGLERGLQVQQPERQGRVRLRRVLQRLTPSGESEPTFRRRQSARKASGGPSLFAGTAQKTSAAPLPRP